MVLALKVAASTHKTALDHVGQLYSIEFELIQQYRDIKNRNANSVAKSLDLAALKYFVTLRACICFLRNHLLGCVPATGLLSFVFWICLDAIVVGEKFIT